jgi:hypothetical protein
LHNLLKCVSISQCFIAVETELMLFLAVFIQFLEMLQIYAEFNARRSSTWSHWNCQAASGEYDGHKILNPERFPEEGVASVYKWRTAAIFVVIAANRNL